MALIDAPWTATPEACRRLLSWVWALSELLLFSFLISCAWLLVAVLQERNNQQAPALKYLPMIAA